MSQSDGFKGTFPGNVGLLLSFSQKAGNFIFGRDRIMKSRHNLQFVWATSDLTQNSRDEIQEKFSHYPIIQFASSDEMAKVLQTTGVKVIGFKKSDLSKSIYQQMKSYRINQPKAANPTKPDEDASKSD